MPSLGFGADAGTTPISVSGASLSAGTFGDQAYTAVEFDLYDNRIPAPFTWYLSNRGPLTKSVGGQIVQYEPRLLPPITLGSTLSLGTSGGVEFFSQALRAQPNQGTIEFAIDFADYELLADAASLHWIGGTFRVYTGFSVAGDAGDLQLVYTGRVYAVSYATSDDGIRASIQTTDASFDLDTPVAISLYPDDFPIEALRGRPIPETRGKVFCIAPVFEDEANLVFRVSRDTLTGQTLDDITEVRVGGVPWRRNDVGPPAEGEWTPDLAGGTFRLGAITLGMEVRCDAQMPGWESFDTAALFIDLFQGGGLGANGDAMAKLRADCPGPVGFYTGTDPRTRSDVLDEVALRQVAWWGIDAAGNGIAGVVSGPKGLPGAIQLNVINIKSLQLNQMIPPAWRLRTEYAPNWSPQTSFAGGVTDQEQTRWKQTGIIAGTFEDPSIKIAEPRAYDAPLVRTLFVNAEDALATLARTGDWTILRYVYDVEAEIAAGAYELFDSLNIEYPATTIVDFFPPSGAVTLAQRTCRIVSMVREIGESTFLPGTAGTVERAQLQLWG